MQVMSDFLLERLSSFLSGVNASSPPLAAGQVSLVGAGPGNPELLTLLAMRRIIEADVVLYDNLVGPAILDLVSLEAARHYVGKKAAKHAIRLESTLGPNRKP